MPDSSGSFGDDAFNLAGESLKADSIDEISMNGVESDRVFNAKSPPLSGEMIAEGELEREV